MEITLETIYKFKILSIIFGLVDVFLTTQYYQPESVFEVFMLVSVAVTFVISMMYFFAVNYLGKSYTQTVKKCDAAIHFVMAVITFVVSIIFIVLLEATAKTLCDPQANNKTEHSDCFTIQAFRIVLGVMCLTNSIIYGSISYLLQSDKHTYEAI